jgi:nucleoside-diphosphate-sugar epimerase
VQAWVNGNGAEYARLCGSLDACDVLVDASGLAAPGSTRTQELLAANAVHAAVLAKAAADAGVRRIVHVGSAVVQGRLDPLDESARRYPLSPYAESKAEAERLLLDPGRDAPPEVVVYRPTSVLAPGRKVTQQLAHLAALPFFGVVGDGNRPVAVTLIQNVAAGIVFAAEMPSPPRIALQPWDGLTTRRLAELLGARRIVSLPRGPARFGLRASARATALSPRLTAKIRRLEVLLAGQRVDARALPAAGFAPPVGAEGWVDLRRDAPADGMRGVAGGPVGQLR